MKRLRDLTAVLGMVALTACNNAPLKALGWSRFRECPVCNKVSFLMGTEAPLPLTWPP